MLTADELFSEAAADLRSARMGTELMGPLLYDLVRSTRPENVVEIGSGLTTLYLAKALQDNLEDFTREQAQLRAKQQARVDAPVRSAVMEWLTADPPLADPHHYDRVYAPSYVTIDDNSSQFSTVDRVASALRTAGVDRFVQRVTGDFRMVAEEFAAKQRRFDFAWFDCGGAAEYRDFLDGFWPLIEPDGGMVAMHYTLTVPAHEEIIEQFAREGREGKYGPLEMLSLREPHKMMQNSCTLIRRCAKPSPRYPMTGLVSLERHK